MAATRIANKHYLTDIDASVMVVDPESLEDLRGVTPWSEELPHTDSGPPSLVHNIENPVRAVDDKDLVVANVVFEEVAECLHQAEQIDPQKEDALLQRRRRKDRQRTLSLLALCTVVVLAAVGSSGDLTESLFPTTTKPPTKTPSLPWSLHPGQTASMFGLSWPTPPEQKSPNRMIHHRAKPLTGF